MKIAKNKTVEVENNKPQIMPQFSGTAYMVKKLSYLLSQAYELTIQDGVVVKEVAISTEDMPATTIGTASKHLWSQLRGENK